MTTPTDDAAVDPSELIAAVLALPASARDAATRAIVAASLVLSERAVPFEWADIPSSTAPELWVRLATWVDAIRVRYAVDAASIPPCWFLHGALVEELTALWLAHRDAYAPAAAATAPLTWQDLFGRSRDRMKAAHMCKNSEHRVLPAPVPTDSAALDAHITSDRDARLEREITAAMEG